LLAYVAIIFIVCDVINDGLHVYTMAYKTQKHLVKLLLN